MRRLFTASRLLSDADTLLEGGGLLVQDGRVVGLGRSAAECTALASGPDVEHVELGEGLLAPGLVDAHAHLELTALAGRVAPDGGFGGWVRRVVEVRAAAAPAELERGIREGADRLLRGGTTAVGDIDSTGLAAPLLARHPLRARLYREVLDGYDPDRTAGALASVAEPLEGSPGFAEGLAPHAPFSVSPALMRALSDLAHTRAVPLTIHWSETDAELEWLLEGRGALAGLLGPSPRRAGLDLIEAAGLLGPRTSLVHGNLPAAAEPQRIAAAGATLVVCPGSHEFFGRPPMPLEQYRARGVRLALGTDSAASNDDLDMRREMALLRAAVPDLPARDVWRAATEGGAHALGWGSEIGRLAPGFRADFCVYGLSSARLEVCLEELTAGSPAVYGVWVGGVRC